MKYLKVTATVFIIEFLVQVLGYVNLLVSYKYEVDLMETNINTPVGMSKQEKAKRLEEMEQRETEILNQMKTNKILLWVYFFGCIAVGYFLFYGNKGVKHIEAKTIENRLLD